MSAACQVETLMRSTVHPAKPIQHSKKDEVNNPSGQKRELIRAFQFAYTRVRPAEAEPESCEAVGLVRNFD